MGILKWLKERRERYKSLIEYAPPNMKKAFIFLYIKIGFMCQLMRRLSIIMENMF